MQTLKRIDCILFLMTLSAACAVGVAGQTQNTGQVNKPDRSTYALLPGELQIGGVFGGSYLTSFVGQPQGLIGGEFVIGLPHNFGLFGEAAWHSGIDYGLWNLRLGTDLFDVGTGLEWAIPNRTRVVPYLRAGVSMLHIGALARIGKYEFSTSGNKLAANLGFGATVHLKERFGLVLDVRALDGPEMPGMARTAFGFFYRFE